MKQVIVLESRGMVGGACESIRLFIRNMDCRTDLIIPKGEADYISKRVLKGYYGSNVEHIYEFYLPYSVEHTVACEVYDADDMKRRRRIFQAHRKELERFFDEKDYDWIHLNGLGLYPVLNRKYPMTLHVRQVFNGGRLEKIRRLYYLNKSRALIYIDNAAFSPFQEMKKKHLIIANPVDQTGVNCVSRQEAMEKYGVDDACTVFTMAGTVSEGKGVGFVIEAFLDFCKKKSSPCRLLIAGTGEPGYKKLCSKLAGAHADIRFLGQLSREEMSGLYRATDYMVRAEQKAVTGRTVWEALYCGVGLVIQGGQSVREEIAKEMGGCENVYVYKPRDKESLTQVFFDLQGKKTNGRGRSNAREYAKALSGFVKEITEA